MARTRASFTRSAHYNSTENEGDGENGGDSSETHDDETDAMKWCDYMRRKAKKWGT